MANQYKNKVIYGNQTLMDITDTTATEDDVLEGEVFYTANGARGVGTLGDATTSTHGLMSAADKEKLDNMIDDTAGEGDTDKAWSADKLASEFDNTALSRDMTVAAPIKSFADGAPYPMGLQFAIDPVQSGSGDPSPSNVRPISGFDGANVTVTGINLFNEETCVRDKYISANGTITNASTDPSVSTYGGEYSDLIPVQVGETYVLSFDNLSTVLWNARVHGYDSSGNWVQQIGVIAANEVRSYSESFVIPDGISSVRLSVNYARLSNKKFGIGSTYSITFPSAAGTVYGGTVTVNPDGTGELVVDRAKLVVLNQDVTYNSGGKWFTVSEFIPNSANPQTNGNVQKGLCSDVLKAYSRDALANDTSITYGVAVNAQGRVLVRNLDYSNISDAVSFINSHQIVYQLATPITYSLTPGQVLALLGQNNVWADTGDIQSLSYVRNTVPEMIRQDTAGQIQALATTLSTVALSGSYTDLLNKPDLSQYLTTVPVMTGATSSTVGTSGLVPAPATTDVDKFLAGDGTYKSGGLPMVILSYGNSTWNDFINAYNNNVIVYCRASSNSNPASGSQTRMAFMAYVNNGDNPTNVEFQYYRSVNTHSDTQMSDQVYIYKLDKTSGWSVTVREAGIKQIVVGNGLTVSYSNNTVTINLAEE